MDHAAPPASSALLGALGALVVGTLVCVTIVRISGVGAVHADESAVLQERPLRFEDRADGGITVRDARDGSPIGDVAPGTNGFLRSAMRGLARERRRMGIGAEPPFELVVRTDGRLTLEDPGTGRRIDLRSFGATQSATFERLLTARPASPAQGTLMNGST